MTLNTKVTTVLSVAAQHLTLKYFFFLEIVFALQTLLKLAQLKFNNYEIVQKSAEKNGRMEFA